MNDIKCHQHRSWRRMEGKKKRSHIGAHKSRVNHLLGDVHSGTHRIDNNVCGDCATVIAFGDRQPNQNESEKH